MDLARSLAGGRTLVEEESMPDAARTAARVSGKVRGTIIRSLIDTYESDHGDRALGRLLADLAPESRRICLQGILESAWYPQQILVELAWATSRRLGPEGCTDLAYRSQSRHLQRLRRLVHRGLACPRALLPCVMKGWRRFQDTGYIQIHRLEDESAILSVEDNPAVLEPGYAEALLGSLFALVRMGGASRVSGGCERHPPARTMLELAWN